MTSPNDDAHGSDAMTGPHGVGDHGEDHGHDDHAHGDGQALGPVNTMAWGAGAIGILAGLVVAAVLAAGTGRFG
jgi:hypothetical protein